MNVKVLYIYFVVFFCGTLCFSFEINEQITLLSSRYIA